MTQYSQRFAVSAPAGMVDQFLAMVKGSLPENMRFEELGPPLELGYVGWWNKRRVIKQRFRLVGTERQLEIYANAIEKFWR